jgi:hypothetical protein
MEEPWIIKKNERRSVLFFNILISSFLYFSFNCHSTPKTMETRGSVKGKLVDSSGKPISDAVIMVVSGSGSFNDIASVSNDTGEFKISNVVIPGKYVLQIQNNDQQKRQEVNLQSQDSVINVTF